VTNYTLARAESVVETAGSVRCSPRKDATENLAGLLAPEIFDGAHDITELAVGDSAEGVRGVFQAVLEYILVKVRLDPVLEVPGPGLVDDLNQASAVLDSNVIDPATFALFESRPGEVEQVLLLRGAEVRVVDGVEDGRLVDILEPDGLLEGLFGPGAGLDAIRDDASLGPEVALHLVDNLGLPDTQAKVRMAKVLATIAKKRSNQLTQSVFVAHAPDLALIVLVVLILSAVIFVDRTPRVVTAETAIAAFQIIKPSELKVPHADSPEGKKLLGEIVGRYPSEQIPQGASIDLSKLSRGARLSRELDGMQIFSIKVQPTSLLNNVIPPIKLGVFFSPSAKNDQGDLHVFTVYLLDVHSLPDAVSCVVAAPVAEAQQLLSSSLQGQFIAIEPSQ